MDIDLIIKFKIGILQRYKRVKGQLLKLNICDFLIVIKMLVQEGINKYFNDK